MEALPRKWSTEEIINRINRINGPETVLLASAPTVAEPLPLTVDHPRSLDFWIAEMSDGNTPSWMTSVARLAPALVALSALIAILRAVFSGKSWMIRFEDDFFYYLKIAQNLAHGSGSTFNGIVSTNGYHPLWLLALTGLSFFSADPRDIFAFVAILSLLASLATFYLARRIIREAGISFVLSQGLSAYIAIYALHVFYTGMEVILAVPLVFLVMVIALRRDFWQRGLWQSATLGFAISAMILARLDLLLLAGLLFFFAIVNREVRQTLSLSQIAGLALGLLPVAGYFLTNHFVFHAWLPVSGMAKQGKFNMWPTERPWWTVYSPNLNNRLNQLPIHLGIVVLPLVWKRLSAVQRVVFPSVMLFPTLYVVFLCCISDWQLWLWYLYPLRAALCASIVVFCAWPATSPIIRSRATAAAVLMLVLGEVAVSKWWTDVQPAIHDAAVDIAAFAKTHPGIYAMGDRSGMVSYLISDPNIQTEGLVMDRGFLEHIRRQDPLVPTLRQYHVRYYIGTAWEPYTGCFHAFEPFQAGQTSPHMRSTLCSQPVGVVQKEIYRNIIFDLDKEPQDNVAAGGR